MPKFHTYTLWLFFLVCAMGCHEIFSPDIEGRVLDTYSPADSLFSAVGEVSFWWEDDGDVEAYALEVTRGPSGNRLLMVDTLLAVNSISYLFEEEDLYTWQVRGENAGSDSEWSGGTFYLDLTPPEKALALSFEDDTLGAGLSGTLTWSSLDLPLAGQRFPTTDSLRIYRRNDSLTLGARYFFDESAPREFDLSPTSPLPFNGPGTYHWQVISFDRAGNRSSSDLFRITLL